MHVETLYAKGSHRDSMIGHDVKMICPQQGSIFRDDDVERFLNWFDSIDAGSGWHSVG